jgi:hypothetical protein
MNVRVLDQRKQAKMQWMQDPSQSNVENLNKARRDASSHLGNLKKAYMKPKIEELETNSKLKKCEGLVLGHKRLQEEQGDFVVDPYSILAWWRNCFSQELNVHGVNDRTGRNAHSRTTSA